MLQITPVWLLGHLSGLFTPQVDTVAAGMFVTVFGVFAARKVSQAVKDDIGDGSVFLCVHLCVGHALYCVMAMLILHLKSAASDALISNVVHVLTVVYTLMRFRIC